MSHKRIATAEGRPAIAARANVVRAIKNACRDFARLRSSPQARRDHGFGNTAAPANRACVLAGMTNGRRPGVGKPLPVVFRAVGANVAVTGRSPDESLAADALRAFALEPAYACELRAHLRRVAGFVRRDFLRRMLFPVPLRRSRALPYFWVATFRHQDGKQRPYR